MSIPELRAFLARELAPTPGRLGATLRLTLACLVITIPILTFRIPHSLIAMVVIYVITQEDTIVTVLGSVLGVAAVTIGIGAALLAWQVALDLPALRIGFFAAFLFAGLFLKRVLTLGALGSAFGLPAAMVMIVPDIAPPVPEVLLEFALWLWWCAVLGVSVNCAIQLLLSPGDPLVLLRQELDARLRAVEEGLERVAGRTAPRSDPSLETLAIAGMTRPAAALRTAALAHPWARERRERLSGLITLTDRLVTAARALELTASPAAAREGSARLTPEDEARLVRGAEGCRTIRKSFAQDRRPLPGEWTRLAEDRHGRATSPLADVERTLDEIALPAPFSDPVPAGKPPLLLPDAFENPDYVRFALKGTLAAMICYLLFVGFDYPGIYTSVITCFVVALSTVGASNQKGVLRFGGAAVGGAMGLFSLMYLFPNVETIAGFWLVFGSATAVAAWVNVGSPRISYGGYQVGLAFYKAVLQGFGMAVSATVVRDRLVGIALGLIVYTLIDDALWPVRAADALRARLSSALRQLANLARGARDDAAVDASRQRIAHDFEEVQGLIESSKFEPGAAGLEAIQRTTGEAQTAFVLLLSLARQRVATGTSDAAVEMDRAVAVSLDALADRIGLKPGLPAPSLADALRVLERSARDSAAPPSSSAAEAGPGSGPLTLYRALVAVLTPALTA